MIGENPRRVKGVACSTYLNPLYESHPELRKSMRNMTPPAWYALVSYAIQQRNIPVSCYLLYDHFDHLLDELAHAQRLRRTIQAYVKFHEQRMEYAGRITLETFITVIGIARSERIIHAARMVVDRRDQAADDPQRERQEAQLRERSRFARKLVVEALEDLGIQPDRNLLLTAGLREELMQLETEQLLWEIVVSGEGEAEERRIVLLE